MSDIQTLRLQPPVWALLLAILIGGGFYTYGKTIESRDHTPTLVTVTGEGRVTAAPDIAELRFGVQTGRRATAKEAMAALTSSMNAVVEAVENANVEQKDIRTEQVSLQPSYDWRNGDQTLRGYEASQNLAVKVRDLDTVSEVLGAATGAGANNVGGVQFTIDDPEEARAEARAEALAQAKQKVQILADQLGMRAGKVKGYSEDGGNPMPGPYLMRAEAMDSAAAGVATPPSPPLPQGEQEVRVHVSVTYELE